MSDDITNPLYGKFDEVVDALVKDKPSPEDEVAGSGEEPIVREKAEEGYEEEEGRS